MTPTKTTDYGSWCHGALMYDTPAILKKGDRVQWETIERKFHGVVDRVYGDEEADIVNIIDSLDTSATLPLTLLRKI